MRAIGVSSIALATMVLTATDVRSANNNWCAIYTKPENENCTFATFEQCQAQVWGLGGWCRPNPFPNTAGPKRLGRLGGGAPTIALCIARACTHKCSATSRSHHASLAMNIVRLMVFFVLGLLLGTLLPSLVTWLLG
jgi:hypothetical protein